MSLTAAQTHSNGSSQHQEVPVLWALDVISTAMPVISGVVCSGECIFHPHTYAGSGLAQS